MAREITDTFTIIIKQQANAYTVEAEGPEDTRVDPQPLLPLVDWLDPEHRATLKILAGERGYASSEDIQALGQALYNAIFIPPIATAFGQAQGNTKDDDGVRLRLQIEPPELASLPWEAMHDGQGWLATRSSMPLVRRLPQEAGDKTPEKLQVRGALRILFAGASPADLRALGIEEAAADIQQLLKEAIAKKQLKPRQIVFDVLLSATLEELQEALLNDYHILYFASHGSPQGIFLDDGQGDEVREGETTKRLPGDAYLVSAATLAQALEGKPARLVFLAACNTSAALGETGSLLEGFAQELEDRANLPAIVAMQYPISDRQANELTARFFLTLAAFRPVDVALAEARKALIRQERVGRDVIAPVMYLQAEDGALFRKARNWTKIGLIAVLPVLIILVVVAAMLRQAQMAADATARAKEQIALSRRLAAQARNHFNNQPDLALLLSLEANRIADTMEARGSLLDGLTHSPLLTTVLHGHSNWVMGVAFSPNGGILASASADGSVVLWDVAAGNPLDRLLTRHGSVVMSVAFSPDGKTLASGSYNGVVNVWDVTTRQSLGFSLTDHTDTVDSLAFSPDGKTLASGSYDGTVILWNVATGEPRGEPLTGGSGRIGSVAFSPDGKILASGNGDHTVTLWDIAAQQPLGEPLTSHSSQVNSVAFSPDGKILASGSLDSTVILWDAMTRQPLGQPLTGHRAGIHSLAFSSDGEVLASSSRDNSIILWDVATRQMLGEPLVSHAGMVMSVAFGPDDKTLASGSKDTTIILWNIAARQPLGLPLAIDTAVVNSVVFSPDGKTMASGSDDGTITLWDITTRQMLDAPLTGHSSLVMSVAFSPDGKTMASGDADNAIIFWDVASRQPLGPSVTSHTDWVNDVAFSPDGKMLASASYDGSIILWDVATHQQLGRPLTDSTNMALGLGFGVICVAFSPDGRTLASGSDNANVTLWDVETRQPLGQPLTGHTSEVNNVVFSPDGKTLASCSDGGAIILWDVVARRSLGQFLTEHSDEVNSVAFSPDGKLLASGSRDETVILRDAATGEPLGEPLIGHMAKVNSVAFSQDSETLASGGAGNSPIILWDLSLESWQSRACRIANRDLTQDEWDQFVGSDIPYERTCDVLMSEVEQNPQ